MNLQPIPFQKIFLDQISDAVIIVDNDHVITYVNPEAERRYGVSSAEIIGHGLTEMHRYEWVDAEMEARAFAELESQGYWRGETIHLTRDGRRLHVESSVTRLLDPDGSPIGLMAVIRDVTERKRAEEELRLSHELLQAVFDSSFGHVQLFKAIRNTEGDIVDFEWVLTNKKWNDEWGEMAGKRLLVENPGVVEAGIFGKFVRVTETGESIQDEQYYGHEQFDGWYVQSIVKLGDGCLMSTLDITKRKLAEAALRTSEEKYRTLFESIGEGFVLLEVVFGPGGEAADLIFRDVNPAFERQTGIKDAIGRSVRGAVPGLEEYWFENYAKVALTGEAMRFENEAAPLGRFYEVYAFRAGAAEDRRVGVIFNDVSVRKRAEMALRLSEEKYRTLFESIDEGFCTIEVIFDDEGRAVDYRFLDVNPSFERQTGIANPVGRLMREIAPQHEQHWFDIYGKVAKTGENVRFENEAAQLDRYYDVFAFRVGAPEDNKVGVLFNDVSERRLAEASARERERLRALVRGQEDERRRIARDLHDDLGQQFTALRMKLERLGGANGSSGPEVREIRELAAKIDSAVDRLAWDLRPAALDDLGLTAALEQFVREWAKHTGISAEMLASNMVETRMPAELETNLYRIAQEALHNVHKHAVATHVDVMLQRDSGHLRLVVADGGLGLTSMRERSSLIGGEIHIESTPTSGTSVHVTVPFSPVD